MNEIHGKFECPKCKYNGIIWNDYKHYQKGYFKNWLCRDEYIHEKPQKKYVFYNRKEQKKWYCCFCCGETSCGKCWNEILTWGYFSENDPKKSEVLPGGDDSCCSCSNCLYCILIFFLGILYSIFFLISSIFYLLFFIWADIANYCCGSKRKINYFLVGKFENHNDIKSESKVIKEIDKDKYKIIFINNLEVIKDGNKEDTEIWKYAYPIKKWNSESPWLCYQCKYAHETFEYFIPKLKINEESQNTFAEINIPNEPNPDNGIITILFNSNDFRINYALSCNKKDLFSKAIEKLFIEYPEYKDKQYFCIQSANIIDINKNLEDNKIISGIPIIIKVILMENNIFNSLIFFE